MRDQRSQRFHSATAIIIISSIGAASAASPAANPTVVKDMTDLKRVDELVKRRGEERTDLGQHCNLHLRNDDAQE